MKRLILGIILMAGTAHAGQQLRLKTRTIDTANSTQSQVFKSSVTTSTTSYQIIQFKNSITLGDQNWLNSMGAEVLRYIPEDAYVVRLSDLSQLNKIEASDRVQATLAYVPEFRLNQKALATSVFNENKLDRLHLRAFKGVDLVQLQKRLEKVRDLTVLQKSNGAFVVQVPMGQVQELASIEGLEWVDIYNEPKLQHFNVQDEMPIMTESASGHLSELTGYETGTRIMNFKSAWDLGLTGKRQIVAVADTGLDTGKMDTLNEDFSNLVRPYIGGINSTTWGDPNGHGTHVSGSILNTGSSSNGRVKGGAYDAKLVMISVYSKRYNTITIGPDPRPLFQVAYDDGARIHSNSWGSIQDYGAYNDSARAVDEFMFENPDMLILFSAGNEGVDANQDGRVDRGSVTSPSTAKNALTVGASENLVRVGGVQVPLGMAGSEEEGFRWPVEPLASDTMSNNKDGLAAFSSRGPTQDGRLKPDVVAPGTNILSNCSMFPDAGKLWGAFNDEYCYSGGTSMSTPLVAAAATLVREKLQLRGITQPSAALIKAILMHTSVDMYPGQFGEVGKENGQELLKPGPNVHQGYGRVDVSKAIGDSVVLNDEKAGLATGQSKTYSLASNVRKVTLVYTDAPGSTAAEKALVNNLDIEVHTTSGSFYKSASKKNNVEQIVVPSGMKVTKLVVKAPSVPMGKDGKQPYSLVYSN